MVQPLEHRLLSLCIHLISKSIMLWNVSRLGHCNDAAPARDYPQMAEAPLKGGNVSFPA